MSVQSNHNTYEVCKKPVVSLEEKKDEENAPTPNVPEKQTKDQSLLEQPLHPQLTHCIACSSLSCALGTRQIHVELKLVSLVCMHRRQHNYNPISPLFLCGWKGRGKTYLFIALLLPLRNQHCVRILVLEQPVI